MKVVPAKLGAQPKQSAILGVLLVILVVVYLLNRNPSPPASAAASATTKSAPSATVNPGGSRMVPPRPEQSSGPMPMQRVSSRGNSSADDFRPSLKLPEGTDISRIDPTLKLDLLAKLRTAPLEGGSRSIFEFAQPPPPPLPKVAPIKPGPPVPAKPAPTAAATKPAPPPLPAIPLKFYGYVNSPRGATKRAFFVDGDDIFIAGENEMIRNRYKVIRIGINSAIVEDTTDNNQQTLPLIAELAG